MKKKSLKETNPYLKNRNQYESALIANVITSSAVEGIKIKPEQLLKSGLNIRQGQSPTSK